MLVGRQLGQAPQSLFVDRAQLPLRGVIREHTGQEEREITEAAPHTGPLGIGDQVRELRQLHRVELTEMVAAPPPAGMGPLRPTGNPRERTQQLRQVQPAIGVIEDEQSFMWVTGLPDRSRVIVQGQDFVREGQTVDAVGIPELTAVAQ